MNRYTIGGTVAALALGGWLAWGALGSDRAELEIGRSVAADLEALATATFDAFVAGAPRVSGCIGRVGLEAAPELDDLASYDPIERVMYVRVPATAPSLEASLVHELAHHLEAACAAQTDIRPAFLAAQGHEPTTPWFADVAWESRPSEQFAEAVVEAITGRRSRNKLQLRLTPEAARLVSAWLTSND